MGVEEGGPLYQRYIYSSEPKKKRIADCEPAELSFLCDKGVNALGGSSSKQMRTATQ